MNILFSKTPKYDSPWGGGNRTLTALWEALESRGHMCSLLNNFKFEEITILFLMDPTDLSNNPTELENILKIFKAANKKIVYRIGNIGTHRNFEEYLNLIRATMPYCNSIIYLSEWSKRELEKNSIFPNIGCRTALCRTEIGRETFYSKDYMKTYGQLLRCSGHSWSDNPKKGFEIYQQLDEKQDELNIEFYYIGRKPEWFKPRNYISPLFGEALANELRKSDFYVSASQFECGPNHIIEALCCGLPVLYSSLGGACGEYAGEYGIEYKDFDDLYKLIRDHESWLPEKQLKLQKYESNIDDMINKYINEIIGIT